jgi:hypothetical protein
MYAVQMGTWKARSGFELFALDVALWQNGDASKELLVEGGKRPPIFSNKVGVNEFRWNAHVLFPKYRFAFKQAFDHNSKA